MTARQRSPRHGKGRLMAELESGMTAVKRPNLLVITWRWRYELALLAGPPAGAFALISHIGWRWGLAEIVVLAAAIGISAVARSWIIAHARCVVTAHRLRTGCAQAWIHSRYGKLPILLLTRPVPGGEQAYFWCRAGTSAEDFEAARELLRSACWAHDVHVTRSVRYSHIVVLDVIRGEGPDPEPPGPPPGEDD